MALNIQILSPFLQGGNRGPLPASLIVVHSTAGTESSPSSVSNAVATLRERCLSYHYIIAKDGTVVKCLPVSLKAYHAGSSYGPREAAENISRDQNPDGTFKAGTSVNAYSIGISFVNADNGEDPYTDEQTESLKELLQELKTAYTSVEWITSHAAVAPKRKIDPFKFDLTPITASTGLKVWP